MKEKIAPNTFMVKTFCELVPTPLEVAMSYQQEMFGGINKFYGSSYEDGNRGHLR
jgi:hypothetical protein